MVFQTNIPLVSPLLEYSAPRWFRPPDLARSTPHQVDLVAYHDHCIDGDTAAWSARKRRGDQAQYIAVRYGGAVPNVTNRHLAVLDFHFAPRITNRMMRSAQSMIILDHHRSAIRNLPHHPNALLDESKSGAMLAWEFFHPDLEPPDIVKHVQDYDLWQHKLPDTPLFIYGLQSLGSGIDIIEKAHQMPKDQMLEIGNNHYQKIVKTITPYLSRTQSIQFKGHRTRLVTLPAKHWRFRNELATLIQNQFNCELILFCRPEPQQEKLVVSLRRRGENGPDISRIAESLDFSGGGHPGAGSFSWYGDQKSLIAEGLRDTSFSVVRRSQIWLRRQAARLKIPIS